MHQFSNILFSPLTDTGNPAAVRRVSDLAGREGATVTMFGTVKPPTAMERIRHGETHEKRVQAAAVADRAAHLTRWVEEAIRESVETTVEIGDPAIRIVERVMQHGHDLVVVTTDEDRTDQTTIKRLLRKCPCPVWVIRPTRAKIQRVLAAMNPDDDAELNASVLEVAASMTELYGGELHLCHAWELYAEETMRNSAFLSLRADEVDEMVAKEKSVHTNAVEALLDQPRLAPAPWQIHVEKGRPAPTIQAMVQKLRINVLVMGTIARGGITGWLMGNTAETLVDEVHCSVIAVKPPGFLSPLAPPA